MGSSGFDVNESRGSEGFGVNDRSGASQFQLKNDGSMG
jgi:hypothetical protein